MLLVRKVYARTSAVEASWTVSLAMLALMALSLAAKPADFDTKSAAFDISFHKETAAYRDLTARLLPGASLTIDALGAPGQYDLHAADGSVIRHGAHQWVWHAPQVPGLYDLRIDGPAATDPITLHVFVMVPASEVRDGLLNGYHIGTYPSKPLNGNPIYRPPSGFIEVTKANQDTKVSPHFRLKQFVCKEDPTTRFPKYVVLEEGLPLELEAILERVNTLGFHVNTLHVMSAFRTPYYNHGIGDVRYSMHQWGSAADIYIDKADRGQMDDLNHDGRIDVDDAKYLYDAIEQMLAEPPYVKLQGGMGLYPATTAHPPFVHVDVRGVKARWRG
jgi:Peptidase M15